MNIAQQGPRQKRTARVKKVVLNVTEQSAPLSGIAVNEFAVQTAREEAPRSFEKDSVIRLSRGDARKLLCLLANPPKPNRRLREAVEAFRESIRT